jgi:uncharacterized protein (DUF433 family)
MLSRRSRSNRRKKVQHRQIRTHVKRTGDSVRVTIGDVETIQPKQNAQYQAWKRKLVRDPEIMAGETVFPNSRLTVRRIASLMERGESPAIVLEDYPYLTRTDLEFAQIYCQRQTRDRACQPL